MAWMFQIYFVSVTVQLLFSGLNRSDVFHLAGHLRTAISADANFVSYLSITGGAHCKQGQK